MLGGKNDNTIAFRNHIVTCRDNSFLAGSDNACNENTRFDFQILDGLPDYGLIIADLEFHCLCF